MEACAGRLSRVSNKPHSLCRDCALYSYGITGGIRPAWSETDGRAECGSRVHRGFSVGDGPHKANPPLGVTENTVALPFTNGAEVKR